MREKAFRGNATFDEQAETLKETVYVTFTILAVLIANAMHDGAHSSSDDLRALAGVVTVTAAALTITMFVADLLSHMAVQDRSMTRAEFRHALRTAVNPVLVSVFPAALLWIGSLVGWSFTLAIGLAIAAVCAALAAVGWVAVRRSGSSRGRRLIILVALVVLSLCVVGLQLIAHS